MKGIIAVMLVGLSTACADKTLMLACEGTKTEGSRGADRSYTERTEATSMSIVVNFAARTVTGFRQEERLLELTIGETSETTISFAGSNSTATPRPLSFEMRGTIDRVTGSVEAHFASLDEDGVFEIWSNSYALKCKPIQRMF